MIFKHESKAHKILTSPYLTTGLLIAVLAVGIINLALPDGAIKMEKLRAGGAENFAKVVELYSSEGYKSQQKTAIDGALAQFGGEGNPTPTVEAPTTDTATNGGDDMKSELANIKKNAYIEGNPNARLTVLEYSDLECPFCKRHHQNGTIAKLLKNYPDDVNHIFRQFPLNNIHPDAQKAAEATECAGDQK
ncbi:thioredoxin domain-containing protein [Patescibacteria group bacterium]|nr:thioredoxin domain-containing protein [Patescibacteria group bacterium]